MGKFKSLDPDDIVTTTSVLNQLIDVVQEDVSGSLTRKKYQVFVTGGIGPGITSSLFQTIYDQDYSLQTANEIFDMTMGIFSGSAIVTNATTGEDENKKMLFPSQSLMMREKINVYRGFAQLCLGDADKQFIAPYSDSTSTATDNINAALFLSFKRLFVRDGFKRETFALKLYPTASDAALATTTGQSNLDRTSEVGTGEIITDLGMATSHHKSEDGGGGDIGDLCFASNTSNRVGLIFYQQGLVVLDMEKIISGTQKASGSISAMTVSHTVDQRTIDAGKAILGTQQGNIHAKFVPDFIVSASMDDVIDHFAQTRFQSGSLVASTFQNNTEINSTLYFCRASPSDFNLSSHPTYTDTSGKINVVDDITTDSPFTFVTSVGLYDADETLLAVAKMSRPIEKNDEKDITFRVRLDF